MFLFSQVVTYWRLAWGLRGFLKEPVTLEQSREIVRQGLQDREHNLLALAKRAIYDNENSPYLKLLEVAGCEYGDFEKMVRSGGIEQTLHQLRKAGAYLSIEEFKCQKETVRSGKVLVFKESDFDTGRRTREAAKAPQSGPLIPPLRTVYSAEELQSIAD